MRCFAESDLIHKQQLGYPVEDLLYGLCQALVRNYLANLALGKDLLPKISFQGGVATNKGMVKAFFDEFEELSSADIIGYDGGHTIKQRRDSLRLDCQSPSKQFSDAHSRS